MGSVDWGSAVLSFTPLVIFAALLLAMIRNGRRLGPGAPDKYAQLERIASLRDRGILTESEFEVEKRKILAGDEKRGFPTRS